jgi:hypothetical protein
MRNESKSELLVLYKFRNEYFQTEAKARHAKYNAINPEGAITTVLVASVAGKLFLISGATEIEIKF